jgi:hypothetical protein
MRFRICYGNVKQGARFVELKPDNLSPKVVYRQSLRSTETGALAGIGPRGRSNLNAQLHTQRLAYVATAGKSVRIRLGAVRRIACHIIFRVERKDKIVIFGKTMRVFCNLMCVLQLTVPTVTLAADALPPEVRADLLRAKIIDKVRTLDQTHDYESILDAIDEYKKLPLAMPPVLGLVEAKAAKHMGNASRAVDALRSVLAGAPRGSAAYNEALTLYPLYEADAKADEEKSREEKEKAQERQQYDAAVATHTSDAYKAYLSVYGASEYAADIRQRLASCHTVSTQKPVLNHQYLFVVGDANGRDNAEACAKAMQEVSNAAYGKCQGVGASETDRSEEKSETYKHDKFIFGMESFTDRHCHKEYRLQCTTTSTKNVSYEECN